MVNKIETEMSNLPQGKQILLLKEELTNILNKWDPCMMVECGVPKEQEYIINSATMSLRFNSTEEDICRIFKEIGETFTFENLNVPKEIIEQIKEALNKIKNGEIK